MPIVRATANQKRLLPPKSNRDTSGKRVVKEVYSERVKVASTATSTWSWRLSPCKARFCSRMRSKTTTVSFTE